MKIHSLIVHSKGYQNYQIINNKKHQRNEEKANRTQNIETNPELLKSDHSKLFISILQTSFCEGFAKRTKESGSI